MIAVCRVCGKEYRTHPAFLKRRANGGYCSRECKIRHGWLTVSCPQCGQTFEARRYRVARRRYCSHSCASKANHPVTGIRDRTCQVCGATFTARGGAYQPGGGKYCSRACYGTTMRGLPWAKAGCHRPRKQAATAPRARCEITPEQPAEAKGGPSPAAPGTQRPGRQTAGGHRKGPGRCY